MEPMKYVKAIRRRWRIIFAMVVLAGVAGWLTTETLAEPGGTPSDATYHASALILNTGDSTGHGGFTSLETMAFLATTRTVADRVAEKLDFKGDSSELAQRIEATPDSDTGVLDISATGSDAKKTEELANTFAEQLLAYLLDQRNADIQAQITALKSQIEDLKKQDEKNAGDTTSTDQSSGGGRGSPTDSSSAPTSGDSGQTIATLQGQLETLKTDKASPLGPTIIERADAKLVPSKGIEAPNTRAGRVGLAALLGLILGVVLALVLERFDNKIRTKAVAEQRYGLPVLAEVPRFPRSQRRTMVAANRPDTPVADAFRLLGAGITRMTADHESAMGNGSDEGPSGRPVIILVTSSGPSEGKTTVVANLAAVYAEVGKRVLVLSCDLRRPAIHGLFGMPDHPGLSDALVSANGESMLDGRVLQTSLANVSMVPTGKGGQAHSGLLGSDHMRRILEESRSRADVILMDTAPILVSSEVAPLIAEVDAVVLVAEAGKTSGDLAERTAELVARLGAPVVGVVLNRATEIAVPKGYHRYYYSSSAGGSRRKSASNSNGDDQGDRSAAPSESVTTK